MTVIDNSNGAVAILNLKPYDASLNYEGKMVFAYTASTGVLKLNPEHFPEGDLEKITSLIDSSPKKTAHVALTFFRESHAVDGIREVSYFAPGEEVYTREPESNSSSIVARWPPVSRPVPKRRGLVQRMRDKFAYYTGIEI